MNCKKELEVIYENIKVLCTELEGVDESDFTIPIEQSKIDEWEKQNNVKIPECYKDWLSIVGYSYICGGLLELFMPSLDGYYGRLVPREYVVIGNMIGDGERICFEKYTGEFIRYDHGFVRPIGDFKNLLAWVIEYIKIMLNVKNDTIRYVAKPDLLRRKAVQGFWIHERELLSNGECTRQWKSDEIECIYNISVQTGNKRYYAGKPIKFDNNGKKVVDENETPIRYEGHHMMSYAEYPEHIDNWKNIQALTPEEHMLGAHGTR